MNFQKEEELLHHCFIDSDNKLRSSIDLTTMGIDLVLNKPGNVEIAQKSSQRNDILEMQGIEVADDDDRMSREYVICVFQTDVPTIYKSNQKGVWLGNNKKTQFVLLSSSAADKREVRRVKRIAIRAIYALGLDYGVVRCGVRDGTNVAVLALYLNSKLNERMLSGFKNACRAYLTSLVENMPLKEILLGCDLEFVMKDQAGELLLASDYFPRYGVVGCDNVSLDPQNTKQKPIGEFRPAPTPCPKLLTDSIFVCLLRALQKTKRTKAQFLAGNMPLKDFPIGGHIHFSGIAPNFKMLRALDNYLALPLILIEDPKGQKRRPNYGFLGDFRYKQHGGFEYRTLPSWMFSPVVSQGILALSKIIIFNYKDLQQAPLNNRYMQKAYYYGDKEMIRPWLDMLWADITRCEGYGTYKECLLRLYHLLRSEDEWSEEIDICKEWQEYYDDEESFWET